MVGSSTAPTHQLEVRYPSGVGNGGIFIKNNLNASGWLLYGYSTGDLELRYGAAGSTAARGYFDSGTGAYTATSDRRLKKNIEPLTGVLDKVMALRPSRYHLRSMEDAAPKVLGLIAQEVLEVFPEAVSYRKDDDLYMMRYTDLVPVAIAAIQEQQAQIAALRGELERVKRKISGK